ncbi:MAG: hypothetical protein JW787_11420 [Sedimentisphaerales bacterium]|nr:hypothetical protein [Sedimentisphaerales bacterium]
MDKERFRKKYLLGIFLSPLTLFPAVAGLTGFLGCMLFNKVIGAVTSLAIGLGFGFGVLFQRLIIGSEKIARRAQQEVEEEEREAREARLDKLDKELRRTPGKQDEEALRELRFLVDKFSKSDLWRKNLDMVTANNLLSTIDEIFDQCISSLNHTIELYKLSQEAPSERISRNIMEKRDSIIIGVQKGAAKLNETLCEVQDIGGTGNQGDKLSILSRELNDQLDIARRVKERLDDLGLNDYDAEKTTL